MSEAVTAREVRVRLGRPTLVALGAPVAGLIGAEALGVLAGPVALAAAESMLLVVLVARYVLGTGPETRAFGALSLVPVLRLAGLVLATDDRVASLLLAGVPVALGVVLAARTLELPGVLGLTEIRLRSQWHVALAAGLAAVAAGVAFGVEPVARPHSALGWVLAALIVFLFAGVLEELLFRGLVQGALDPLIGSWSIPVADALFAAAYLDSGSASYTAGMAAFGLACGWWVRRTRSVAGAAVGHGLVAVALLVVA